MDDEFGGGGAAAGLDEPASLKAELWSDEDSSGQEPEVEEFGALHAAGAGAKGARSPCTSVLYCCGSAACRLGHACRTCNSHCSIEMHRLMMQLWLRLVIYVCDICRPGAWPRRGQRGRQ